MSNPCSFLCGILCKKLKNYQIIWCDFEYNIKYTSNNFLGYVQTEILKLNLNDVLIDDFSAITDEVVVLKYKKKDNSLISYETEIVKNNEYGYILIIAINTSLMNNSHIMANISHEIRTPLNAVIGTLQVFNETELNLRILITVI